MVSMTFNMDRPNLIRIGDEVTVTEGHIPAGYYYTIEPAVAMSGNYSQRDRLKTDKGKVTNIERTPRGYIVTAEFDS